MTQDELVRLATAIARNMALPQKEVLSIDEAAQYTGLKKSYLYKLTSAKEIPHYKPKGKYCFFRRTELEAWLTANRISSDDELSTAAQTYCMKHPVSAIMPGGRRVSAT